MATEILPIPDLEPEKKVADRVQALRNELKVVTPESYQAKFEEWKRAVDDLAKIAPISEGRDSLFELELPGDVDASSAALAAARIWLSRGLSDPVALRRMYGTLQAIGELTNNAFQHALKLGDRDPDNDEVAQKVVSKPKESVWFGLHLVWGNSEPSINLLLETTGTVPPREELAPYFEIDEDDDEDETRLILTPKSPEDFVPDLDTFDLDLADSLLASQGKGKMGLRLVAGFMEKDDKLHLVYENDVTDPSKNPVHNTVELTAKLAS